MAFAASTLPPSARALFEQAQKAPPLWPSVIRESYRVGIKDLNKLTDIAFFVHHPHRNGKAISAGENQLIKEWKGYRETIRSWMPGAGGSSSSKPASAPPEPVTPSSPSLTDLLRDVNPWDYARNVLHWKHLYRLKDFLVRGLDGQVVDDAYWQYSFFDGYGRERNCTEKHSVSSVSRGNRQQHVMRNFVRLAEGYATVSAVGKCLAQVENAVSCHTFVVVRWAHQNAGTGDGSLSDFTEMRYLREMATLARRAYPESVYAVYGDELAKTLGNAG